MRKVHAAIIEDEYPAARLLNHMLTTLRPEWEITLLPGTVEDSVKWFAENPHPDVLFLDIQLTDGNSFLFLEQAHPSSMIIFTTAYDEYAVRAFAVNSIDYLLKPIHEDRLLAAITKFERLSPVTIREFNDQMNVRELVALLSKRDESCLNSFPYYRQSSFLHHTSRRYCIFLFGMQDYFCGYKRGKKACD